MHAFSWSISMEYSTIDWLWSEHVQHISVDVCPDMLLFFILLSAHERVRPQSVETIRKEENLSRTHLQHKGRACPHGIRIQACQWENKREREKDTADGKRRGSRQQKPFSLNHCPYQSEQSIKVWWCQDIITKGILVCDTSYCVLLYSGLEKTVVSRKNSHSSSLLRADYHHSQDIDYISYKRAYY